MKRGYIVLSDRFADSTYAYQGAARGFIQEVLEMERFVLRGFQPDYMLFFDLSFEESDRRLQQRTDKSDRFDEEHREFKRRVWQGYQDRFQQFPDRMVRVGAMQDIDGVRAQLLAWVHRTFR